MSDQAKVLRGLFDGRRANASRGIAAGTPSAGAPSTARTIAVTSGKGGVGKTNIALNLAVALAEADSRVCLLDANLGLGNVDLLCGLNGYWNLSHVVSGARMLKDVVLTGPAGVSVIPGASGLVEAADSSPLERRGVVGQLLELEAAHDYLVVDTGAGIHRAVRQFAAAADVVLVVTVPEPTAIADAYAMVKALSSAAIPHLEVVVNQADSPRQGRAVADRLQQTARLFLRTEIDWAGCIPRDPEVVSAVTARRPLLLHSPHSPASRAIGQLARRVRKLAEAGSPRGPFFPRVEKQSTPKAA